MTTTNHTHRRRRCRTRQRPRHIAHRFATPPRLCTPDQAAEFLQIPVRQLQQWRWLGIGPAYIKVGRAVRYRQTDLDAYIEAHRIQP
jgi:hypothetical protein